VKGVRRVMFYQNGEVSSIEGYYRSDVEKIIEAVRARDSWRNRHPGQAPDSFEDVLVDAIKKKVK
jgi:hypothetical protein